MLRENWWVDGLIKVPEGILTALALFWQKGGLRSSSLIDEGFKVSKDELEVGGLPPRIVSAEDRHSMGNICFS